MLYIHCMPARCAIDTSIQPCANMTQHANVCTAGKCRLYTMFVHANPCIIACHHCFQALCLVTYRVQLPSTLAHPILSRLTHIMRACFRSPVLPTPSAPYTLGYSLPVKWPTSYRFLALGHFPFAPSLHHRSILIADIIATQSSAVRCRLFGCVGFSASPHFSNFKQNGPG